MEISIHELKTILNRVVTRREFHCSPNILYLNMPLLYFEWTLTDCSLDCSDLCNCVFFAISDKDLKTDGFSTDSCRTMVNLMDVSSFDIRHEYVGGTLLNDTIVLDRTTFMTLTQCLPERW